MPNRHRENGYNFASYFRRTAVELNNISICFIHLGNHQVALETLADALRIMKYCIVGGGNEVEYRNDADESIGRAVEALRREDMLLTRDSGDIHLSNGTRRLHDAAPNETNMIHRVEEESATLLFNMALTHRNHGLCNNTHASLQQSLTLHELVLRIFGVELSVEGIFEENQCTSLTKLHLIADTFSSMGGIYSHLRQYSYAEACFSQASRIAVYSIVESSFSAAAA